MRFRLPSLERLPLSSRRPLVFVRVFRTEGLFVSQRDYRIDARGASSRDGARRHGDSEQQKSHAQEREPVARFDAIKQAAQETRERQAGDDTDGHAGERGADSLAENQSHDVAALRAQGHADTDFPRALEDHVRDQPVQPYNGENQGQRSKTADQI